MTDKNYNLEVGNNIKDIGMGAVGVGKTLAWGYSIYQIGSLVVMVLVLILIIIVVFISYNSPDPAEVKSGL